MPKAFHILRANTWQAKFCILLAISLSLTGGNSSPEKILGKLFPDNYPLKWKYIYPCQNLSLVTYKMVVYERTSKTTFTTTSR